MCVICPSMRVGTVVAAAGAATALWLLYRRRSSQGVGASEAGASSVDYVTELVCSPVAAESPPITYKRLSLDRFFGLFTKMYLCPTWFYDRPLDPDAIRESLEKLVTKLPALAGRLSNGGKTVVLCNAGVRFSYCKRAGSAFDYTSIHGSPEPHRAELTDAPPDAADGRSPLFTVRITNFADGTSAIGFASPHCMTDGKSYFAIIAAFAAIHLYGTADVVPDISFDCASVWEQRTATPDLDKTESGWKGLLGARGVALLFKLVLTSNPDLNDKLFPRAKVHLSLSELTRLKADVGDAAGAALTTNEALSAALLVALAGLDWPGAQGREADMIVNMQGKGLFKGVREVAGNFSTAVTAELPKPMRELSIKEAAAHFRKLGDMWRDDATAAKIVERTVAPWRYLDMTGAMGTAGDCKFAWMPGMKAFAEFVVNNQCVYPVAQIRFGSRTDAL